MTTEEGARIVEQARRIAELEEQLKNSVQVVRCKDCKHWVGNGLLWDAKIGKIPPFSMCWDNEPDEYCSFGERGTDGKETTNT